MKSLLKTCVFIGLMCTYLLGADHKGEGSLSLYDITSENEVVTGDLKYKWRLWTLVGEPVDMLVAKWNIQSVDFFKEPKKVADKLTNPSTGDLKYTVCEEIETTGCIPKHIMEKAKIVKLKLLGIGNSMGHWSTQAPSYSYLFDAGVMSKPYASYGVLDDHYGKWSYNTPGSKNWDTCFEESTEEQSKEIMKSKINFYQFRIHTIKFDFSEVKRYIINQNEKYYTEQERERYDSIVTQSDDPFEVLEKLDKEKSSGKQAMNSDDIHKGYKEAKRQLKEEAKKKESILQVTKHRVAQRVIPIEKDVFIDSSTGLMWQDDKAAKTVIRTWSNAKQYCQSLTLGGWNDWYLPNIDQLNGLYKKRNKLKNFEFSSYSSGTSAPPDPSLYAWLKDFGDGLQFSNYKSQDRYVRCVRKTSKNE